ncbi:hypothetical protein [Nostoc punctiforme]|nr:hypothetical protein [Nostoc punctiforme]
MRVIFINAAKKLENYARIAKTCLEAEEGQMRRRTPVKRQEIAD